MTSHDYTLALAVDRHNEPHEDTDCPCERTITDKGLTITWDVDPHCPIHREDELL